MQAEAANGVRASVVLITYNHEPYVAQAIESVLSQRTTFDFELLISEDYSTDRTREIVQSFAERHPDRIRLLLSPRNLNDNTVVSRGVTAARGDYVALLDGDDYWTSPEKLEKQVRLLDERPDCAICFHNVQVVYEDSDEPDHPFHIGDATTRLSAPVPKPTSQLDDLVKGNFIQTCSVMLRAAALGGIPDWYAGLPVGDWPLYVLYAQHGDIAYIDDTMAAYRVHAGGWWSAGLSHYRKLEEVHGLLEIYDLLDRHLDGRYHGEIRRASSYLHRTATVILLAERSYRSALRHWRAYAAAAGVGKALTDKSIARAAAQAVGIGRKPARAGQAR